MDWAFLIADLLHDCPASINNRKSTIANQSPILNPSILNSRFSIAPIAHLFIHRYPAHEIPSPRLHPYIGSRDHRLLRPRPDTRKIAEQSERQLVNDRSVIPGHVEWTRHHV